MLVHKSNQKTKKKLNRIFSLPVFWTSYVAPKELPPAILKFKLSLVKEAT